MTKERILYDSYNHPYLDDDYVKELYKEINGELPENDDVLYNFSNFLQECDTDDIMLTLDIKGDYVLIADLGLWNGRRSGYKEVKNIKDALYNYDDIIVKINQRNDLEIIGMHHDGSNYMIVREFKCGLSFDQRERFLDLIYNGEVNNHHIGYYTTSVVPELDI